MEKVKNRLVAESRLLRQGKRGLFRIIFSRSMLLMLLLAANFLVFFLFAFRLLQGLPLLFGSVTVFTAVVLIIVLNDRGDPSIKLSWCVMIALVPLPGAVMYFFNRYNLGSRVSVRLLKSSIADSLPYIGAGRAPASEDAGLAHYLRNAGPFPAYGNSDVQYFPLGDDMFPEMLRQLEKAEKFIFLEYFIIVPGKMWGEILKTLCEKAKQGVEVRLLYDGMNSVANLPYGYPKQLQQMGIKCKVFSPVTPFVSTHYNNRDHRKILVIDGHTAFTGGINLQDRYINEELVCGHWKDTGVMVRGEAAQGFTMLFLQMWNATERERIYEPYLVPQRAEGARGLVIPYGDIPSDAENVGETVYLTMLNQAKRYAYIMTPYLILDGQMLGALRMAAMRGVDVRIILPHIPDKRTAFALAQNHYRELLEAGVKIYEYTPGFVHAKVFLCDDRHGAVGTVNLDYRSLYLHYECGAYLYDVEALGDIRRDFDETMEKSQQITLENMKNKRLLLRLLGKVLRVIAPLM
ncbi:MAG: cardiolipin synthase [Oscillospiraceae bacterium]|nr:cardiolipin synthase [Oscillospiraceae bacterium]